MRQFCALVLCLLLAAVSSPALASRPTRNRPVATQLVLLITQVTDDQVMFTVDVNGGSNEKWWETQLTVSTDRPVTLALKSGEQQTGSAFTMGFRTAFSLRMDPNAPATTVTVTDPSGKLQPAVTDLTWLYHPTTAVAFRAPELELYDAGPPWYGKVRLMPVDAAGQFAPFGGNWRQPRKPVVRYSDGSDSHVAADGDMVNETSSGLEVWLYLPKGCPANLKVEAGWEDAATQTFAVPVDCPEFPVGKPPGRMSVYFYGAVGLLGTALVGWLLYKGWRKKRSAPL